MLLCSLYLHKLGKAPQIEDLLGTATFTGMNIGSVCVCVHVCVCVCVGGRGGEGGHHMFVGLGGILLLVFWAKPKHTRNIIS